MFVLQLALMTRVLRTQRASHSIVIGIVVVSLWFEASWQFAQFALLTQSVSLCGVYLLGYISERLHNKLQGAVSWASLVSLLPVCLCVCVCVCVCVCACVCVFVCVCV